MTNEEKFKTATERHLAHAGFCFSHFCCADCPAYRETRDCFNVWLNLEAPEVIINKNSLQFVKSVKILRRSECAILPLVLKGKWFDMITSGEKLEEYRELKPYWAKRMADWMFHPNRIVAFSRAYRKPTIYYHACRLQTSESVPS